MSNIELRLDVYSHNIKISNISKQAKYIVIDFCLTLGERELIKKQRFDTVKKRWVIVYEKILKRIYAAATNDRSEFRIHIHSYNDFIKHLAWNGIHLDNIEMVVHPLEEPTKIELDFIDKRIPREEDQVPAIDYLTSEGKSKVLTLQTGRGKTACANHAINNIKEKVVIILKGMYVQRWLDDLNDCFKFKPGELMVVRGSKDMMRLIELAQENLLDAKIVIITNTTFRMFIDEYEIHKDKNMYGCNPEDFFQLIGAGVRLIDEVHQDFHLNFKIDLYTNIKKCINLSATLLSDNQFLNKMYELMFPLLTRPPDFGYNKYIVVKAMLYHLDDPMKVRYKQRGRTSYSHVVFEESIMKQEKIFKRYKNMIMDIIQNNFVEDWKPGQKLLIFCATVEMCTKLTAYLKLMFSEFDVVRYIAEDDYSVIEKSNIIVSTLKSAGTAVDIPGLKKTLMTVAVGSRQANEQAVGRLRQLKQWPDEQPEFLYLVCVDVPSHLEYHRHKKEVLSDKILSLKEYNTPYKI